MAGVKGKSGGKRENAGRKKNPPDKFGETPFLAIDETSKPKKKENSPLKMPKEFDDIPYAKQAWNFLIECDNKANRQILNNRHYELMKSYCMAVAMRQRLIDDWVQHGQEVTVMDSKGNQKVNPVIVEIEKKSRLIKEFAQDLGLTILGEIDVATKVEGGKTLSGQEEKKDDMFE